MLPAVRARFVLFVDNKSRLRARQSRCKCVRAGFMRELFKGRGNHGKARRLEKLRMRREWARLFAITHEWMLSLRTCGPSPSPSSEQWPGVNRSVSFRDARKVRISLFRAILSAFSAPLRCSCSPDTDL